MALPVGTSWSTIRQTSATTDNHQQFLTGNPLKMLVAMTDQLKVKTDHEQRMVNETTLTTTFQANLALTVPTTASSRSTSPKG